MGLGKDRARNIVGKDISILSRVREEIKGKCVLVNSIWQSLVLVVQHAAEKQPHGIGYLLSEVLSQLSGSSERRHDFLTFAAQNQVNLGDHDEDKTVLLFETFSQINWLVRSRVMTILR